MNLWTEQDEKLLKELQEKKETSIHYHSLIQFSNMIKEVLDNNCVPGIGDLSYIYSAGNNVDPPSVHITVSLTEKGTQIFHQIMNQNDSIKNP